MKKLEGKVALVTGASKGIGAAVARALATEGAAVVVNYASDRVGAERVTSEIRSAGGRAIAVHADVSKSEDVRAMFDQQVRNGFQERFRAAWAVRDPQSRGFRARSPSGP